MESLDEIKHAQVQIRQDVEEIKQKVWRATGFIAALQLALAIFLKWAFK